MAKYQVRPGESLRDSDGSLKTGGDEIELDDEMAQLHRDRVAPVEPVESLLPIPARAP